MRNILAASVDDKAGTSSPNVVPREGSSMTAKKRKRSSSAGGWPSSPTQTSTPKEGKQIPKSPPSDSEIGSGRENEESQSDDDSCDGTNEG